jgi:hypothetical protein
MKFHRNWSIIAHFIARTWLSKITTAAILKISLHFRFCDIWTQHVFLSLCTNFHRNRVVIAHFIAFTWIFNMAAAVILKAVGHFRFCFLTFAGCLEPTCQIWLESDKNWLSYYSFSFFKLAAAAILDLMIGEIWPEIWCVRFSFHLWFKFCVDISWFNWDMSFYWFSEFGWETIDHAFFLAVFGGYWPRKLNETPKGTSLGGNASFEPSTMEIGLPVWPVEVSKKIIWKGRKGKPCIKSHKSVIFQVFMGAEPLARSQWN